MWWTPAPWTCGPYRFVGVSSRARVSRAAPLEQRPDHLGQEASGDAIGPLAGGGDGGVAGLELVAELGRPDPGGDGPPAPGQDGAEEQQGEPGGGPAVEGGGEPGEPLARGGERMRGCHGRLRPGCRLVW